MKTITQTYVIKASPERVFEALTSVEEIKKWSGAGATFEAKKGSHYSMWDEWVQGTVEECIPGEKLVQTWEPDDWEKQETKSVVTFTLKEKDGGTEVTLEQTNVPDEQYKSTRDGWKDYYLGAIKEYLEKK